MLRLDRPALLAKLFTLTGLIHRTGSQAQKIHVWTGLPQSISVSLRGGLRDHQARFEAPCLSCRAVHGGLLSYLSC